MAAGELVRQLVIKMGLPSDATLGSIFGDLQQWGGRETELLSAFAEALESPALCMADARQIERRGGVGAATLYLHCPAVAATCTASPTARRSSSRPASATAASRS